MEITGQCHCGAVRFTARVDPARVFVCHCADCQVISGGPFRAVVPVPVDQVELHGTPKQYVKVAASGNRRAQAFCSNCGSPLFTYDADVPGTVGLRIGCIDERASLIPTKQKWCRSALAWTENLADLDRREAE